MPTLLKRSLVLSFSYFVNQAIAFLSPVLLVRVLSVAEYGKYREFLLFAGLIAGFVNPGITVSLLYLIPKYPARERVWVTQTTLFLLASSSFAVVAIFLAGDAIRVRTSFDFVTLLALYIFFYTNLEFLTSFWLSKKRTDIVLYYSLGRLVSRLAVVVIVAFLTERAESMVLGLVVVECIRCVLVFSYANYRHWFDAKTSRENMIVQLSYFVPLGTGGVIELVNQQLGSLFISISLGTEALALYAIGAFATQIIGTLRGAIADTIFPDIVESKHALPEDALPLWQKATVWYCVLLFPIAIIFGYYAHVIVATIFTTEYLAAAPIFAVFSLLLYLYCFDFHLPLRVQNANRFFLRGNVVALIVNAALVYPAYQLLGLVGPAVALVVSRGVFTIYLGFKATQVYQVRWSQLVRWAEAGKVMFATLVCAPILVVGGRLLDTAVIGGIVFGGAYLASYLLVLRLLGVWDVWAMVRGVIVSRRPQE